MPSSLGPAEIIVILVVALIVLGPKRLPEAGRQVGKALSEIRRWTADMKSEMTSAFDADQRVGDPPPVLHGPAMAPQPQVVQAEVAEPPVVPEPAPEPVAEGAAEAPPGEDPARPEVPPAL